MRWLHPLVALTWTNSGGGCDHVDGVQRLVAAFPRPPSVAQTLRTLEDMMGDEVKSFPRNFSYDNTKINLK